MGHRIEHHEICRRVCQLHLFDERAVPHDERAVWNLLFDAARVNVTGDDDHLQVASVAPPLQ